MFKYTHQLVAKHIWSDCPFKLSTFLKLMAWVRGNQKVNQNNDLKDTEHNSKYSSLFVLYLFLKCFKEHMKH